MKIEKKESLADLIKWIEFRSSKKKKRKINIDKTVYGKI